jgi:hypothetical protein
VDHDIDQVPIASRQAEHPGVGAAKRHGIQHKPLQQPIVVRLCGQSDAQRHDQFQQVVGALLLNFARPPGILRLEYGSRQVGRSLGDHFTAELPEPVKETYVSKGCFTFEYAARDGLKPVTIWWGDGGKYPPEEITASVKSISGKLPDTGCLFVGDRGEIFTTGWGAAGIMKLKGERRWRGVLDHEAAKPIPVSLPRAPRDNHLLEWFEACKGGPVTFTNFDVGARVAEAHLPGILALRLGRPIEWDAANMKVVGAPEADRWIRKDYRMKWLS